MWTAGVPAAEATRVLESEVPQWSLPLSGTSMTANSRGQLVVVGAAMEPAVERQERPIVVGAREPGEAVLEPAPQWREHWPSRPDSSGG